MNVQTALLTLSLVFIVAGPQAYAKGQHAANVAPEASTVPVVERSFVTNEQMVVPRPVRIPPVDDALDGWIEENAERFGLYLDKPRKTPGAVTVQPEVHEGAPEAARKFRVRSESRAVIPEIKPEDLAAGGPDDIEKIYLKSLAMPQLEKNANGSYSPVPVDRKVFTPPAAAAKTTDPAVQIAAVMDDLKFGGACEKFANEKGYGPYGELIVKELMSGNFDLLMNGTDDIRRACPNFDYLNHYEKASVYVKVVASMSFLESTCDEKSGIKKRVQAVNGAAAGLTQLHRDQEGKYGENCSNGDSRSPLKTLRCTLSMLNGQIERTGALLSTKSYWAVLRPQGEKVTTKKGEKKTIVKARVIVGGLKELPLCQRASVKSSNSYKKRDEVTSSKSNAVSSWIRSKTGGTTK